MKAISSTETLVQHVVSRALGIAEAPLDANFFALGGDSLSALEATAALQEGLSCELPLDLMFDVETLRELAARVAGVAAGAAGDKSADRATG